MRKSLIFTLLLTSFSFSNTPTHYFDGKWYHCKEIGVENKKSVVYRDTTVFHDPDSNGGWWSDYDSHGNVIHNKLSKDHESWYEYDKKGNMVHFISFKGEEAWFKWFYDKKKNVSYKCLVDENGKPRFK